MEPEAKKTALRMIPYGLYVLTAENGDGDAAGACVNWVTQASFDPPLVVVCVKADSAAHALIEETGKFALNVLGKGQQKTAFAFFKPALKEGNTLGGEPYRRGGTGSPILESAPAFVECDLVEIVRKGDHSVVVGEVVDAGVSSSIEGRPDASTLCLADLGEKTFYGG